MDYKPAAHAAAEAQGWSVEAAPDEDGVRVRLTKRVAETRSIRTRWGSGQSVEEAVEEALDWPWA